MEGFFQVTIGTVSTSVLVIFAIWNQYKLSRDIREIQQKQIMFLSYATRVLWEKIMLDIPFPDWNGHNK